MPRLRGSRRGRRKTNTFSDVSGSPHAQGSDEESIPRTKRKLFYGEGSTTEKANLSVENDEPQLQIEEDEEEMEVEEDEEFDEQDEEHSTINTVRRLTEDVDVDGDSASCDDDDELNSGEAEAGDEDSDDSLTPAEKAAKLCHLSAKELVAEELELFVFLETASRELKDSYLCIRNMACLLWSEDSSVQVTQHRLFNFTSNNLSVENLRLMLDAGLTTQPAIQSDDHLATNTTATRSGRPTTVVVAGGSNIKELSTMPGSSSRLVSRQLAALSHPSNWNPWGSANARSNLEHMCYLAILFLERYGYINYGMFKILATPLTHVTNSSRSATACTTSGTEVSESIHSTSLSSASSEAPLTPRRAAAERALAVTRRSSSSSQLSQVVSGASQPPPHIIVLGAGIAGLIAARQLTYFGAKVTLLESRDRVGGRVWTHKKGDLHCELGAIIITGIAANPISVLAKQMSLHPTLVNTECSLYDPKGRLISRDMDEKIKQEFNRLLGTASYLCHTKSMDSLTTENGEEKLLSLGEVIELLIKYQQRHRLQLKVTHKKLIIKLLERKNELLDQISTERGHMEAAYERWQTASAKATPCSVLVTPRVMSDASNTADGDSGISQPTSSPNRFTPSSTTTMGNRRDNEKLPGRSHYQSSSDTAETGDGNSESLPPRTSPVVYNVSVQFEVRRLLSELHDAWKKYEPLQTALTRVNRQLEILLRSPPRDVYLTDAERHIMDWHFANLEFANSTQLCNLSLRHWDQDDIFELAGEHCVLRDGYGSLVDGLASAITSGGVTSSLTPNNKQQNQRESQPILPTAAHIELRSSAKRIIYSDKGVRVEALNAAFSQEDLIGHDADALICTLPLGVLKESISLQLPKQGIPQSPIGQQATVGTTASPEEPHNASHLTRLTAPVFQPALPDWKVDAIKRLGFGVLNNVVLIFEKCFWDRSVNLFGHVSSDSSLRGELFLFWSISDKPILHALVAGKAALDLEGEKVPLVRTPSTSSSNASTSPRGVGSASITHRLGGGLHEPIVGRAMQVLRGIFGQESSGSNYLSSQQGQTDRKKMPPNPVDAFVTRWQMDPDSRGSCSYVAVGSTGADYNLLSDPVPTPPAPVSDTGQKTSPLGRRSAATPIAPATPSYRLFFAGEHTSRCYPATVHGALLSGLREAARVANTFFPGPTPIRQHSFKLNAPVNVGLSTSQ